MAKSTRIPLEKIPRAKKSSSITTDHFGGPESMNSSRRVEILDKMKKYTKEVFCNLELPKGAVFEDASFERCVFDGCQVRGGGGPSGILRNVEARKCSIKGAPIYFATFEDVLVEDLASGSMLNVVDCLFKHLTLRGAFDKLFFRQTATPPVSPVEYYANVDWALDIRNAEFKEVVLRGVPSALVRRNRELQIVVKRADALRTSDWKGIPSAAWKIAIADICKDKPKNTEVILISEVRGKDREAQSASVRMLHEMKLAD